MDLLGPESILATQTSRQIARAVALGLVPDVPSPHALAQVDEYRGQTILVDQHPEMLLDLDSQLWAVVDEFRQGVWNSPPDHATYATTSGWALDCVRCLHNARERERTRRIKRDGTS